MFYDIMPTFPDLVVGLNNYIYSLLILFISVTIYYGYTYFRLFNKKGNQYIDLSKLMYPTNENKFKKLRKTYCILIVLATIIGIVCIIISIKQAYIEYTKLVYIGSLIFIEMLRVKILKELELFSSKSIQKSPFNFIKNNIGSTILYLFMTFIILPLLLASFVSSLAYPKATSTFDYTNYKNLYSLNDIENQDKLIKIGENKTYLNIYQDKHTNIFYLEYLSRDKTGALLNTQTINLSDPNNTVHIRYIDNIVESGYVPCVYTYETIYLLEPLNKEQEIFMPLIDYKNLESYVTDPNKKREYWIFVDSELKEYIDSFNIHELIDSTKELPDRFK